MITEEMKASVRRRLNVAGIRPSCGRWSVLLTDQDKETIRALLAPAQSVTDDEAVIDAKRSLIAQRTDTRITLDRSTVETLIKAATTPKNEPEVVTVEEIIAAWNTRPATLTPDQVETVRRALEMAIKSHKELYRLYFKEEPDDDKPLKIIEQALALLPQGEKK